MSKSLIFLYGLTGVGKLTVAKELSKLSGFPIYHNHLTSDLVYSVFDRGEKTGSLLKQKIRNLVIQTWGKTCDFSLITTLIYKKGDNENYFEEMSSTAKKYGASVYYFHLECDLEELKKRVCCSDRAEFGKITEVELLEEKMREVDMLHDVPFENNYSIDTTKLSAKETAEKILGILKKG